MFVAVLEYGTSHFVSQTVLAMMKLSYPLFVMLTLIWIVGN